VPVRDKLENKFEAQGILKQLGNTEVGLAGEAEMTSTFLPFERVFDEETSTWCLTGRDQSGDDVGVGAAPDPDKAAARLRDWVLDSLLAAAGDGENRPGDLLQDCPDDRDCLVFGPPDLIPVMIRLLGARRGWRQAQVADRLGISQQAYAKLERPGTNLGLKTLVRVERACEAPLLEYA
jgi:DNA-binding XRE family transcriptional regulator